MMNLPKLLDVLDGLGIDNPIVCASINKIGFRGCVFARYWIRNYSGKPVAAQHRLRHRVPIAAQNSLRPSRASEPTLIPWDSIPLRSA